MKIGNKTIGPGKKTFIIAEAGVNHNGKLALALRLVDAAARAGADAIKFQTFKAEQVVSENAAMPAYQKKNLKYSGKQLAMLKKLELKENFYGDLIARCHKRKIIFLSTPHGGFESVDLLNQYRVVAFKFGSGDLTNLPLLSYAAKFKKPIILGTGMATLAEVREAANTIKKHGNRQIIILHCTSTYPCPTAEVNLRAMVTLKNKLGVIVGYSDHTMGITVPIMAATMGASVIEKHFTLDRSMPGPDHLASLEPKELTEMVASVKNVPVIMGSGRKPPFDSELKTAKLARKSIVALQDIQPHQKFTIRNIGIKRPGTGLAPKLFPRILGRISKRQIKADALIKREDFT